MPPPTQETAVPRDAGRDLDALVAEKVMGFTRTIEPWLAYGSTRNEEVWRDAEGKVLMWEPTRYMAMPSGPPPYSRDIRAALEVIEKLGRATELRWQPGRAVAMIGVYDPPGGVGHAETLAHAICLAALHAVAPRDSGNPSCE